MIKKNVYNGVYEYTTASNPSCNAILFNQEEDSIMKEMHGKFSLLEVLQPWAENNNSSYCITLVYSELQAPDLLWIKWLYI